MKYINFKLDSNSPIETIDQFETNKEARKMLKEYIIAYGCGSIWLSTRATKEWRESQES